MLLLRKLSLLPPPPLEVQLWMATQAPMQLLPRKTTRETAPPRTGTSTRNLRPIQIHGMAMVLAAVMLVLATCMTSIGTCNINSNKD